MLMGDMGGPSMGAGNWSPVFSVLEGGVGREWCASSRYSPGRVSLYSCRRLEMRWGQPGLASG